MTLDDFQPYVLPWAKQCPGAVADFNTRLAVIELCRVALLWRTYQDPVDTVADQTAYAYGVAAGQQVWKLLSLKVAEEPVEVVEPSIGKARDSLGTLTPYAYGTLSGFELRPAYEAGIEVITYSVVTPTLDATEVPDELARYMELISHGALARILSHKDKAYSDPAGAARSQGIWDAGLGAAQSAASRGFARATQRTRPMHF